MMRHSLWLVAILAAASISVPRARAQPAPAVDKAKARTAKQYVDAGLAAQDSGDYDTAITMYQKAYDLVPHPVLIFNIAQATRLAGREDAALAHYARYLAADPNGAQAKTARELVAEINAKRAEAAKAEAANAEAAKREAAEREAAKREAAKRPPPTTATSPSDRGALRIAGLATAAVGVVGVGLGVGFAVHGKNLQSEVEDRFDPAKADAGHRANTLAWVGTIGGGALIATGAALYIVGRRPSTERLAVAPVVAAHTAGLVISGVWQ